MNRRIVIQFTLLTFVIALATCGLCVVLGLFGFTADKDYWLYVLIVLCAFSPTIASYIVLKRNEEVGSFREWLKNVFAVKSPPRFYLLVIALTVIYFIPQAIITGLDDASPVYMFFVLLPLVLIAGGIEEAGWSYVLRRELDKQFGLVASSVIIAAIWAVWHLPVFLPQGRIGSLPWFGMFAIDCLGQSFALGAIMRATDNVWLCVLFHTLCNAVSGTLFIDDSSLLCSVISTAVVIAASLAAAHIFKKDSEPAELSK